MIALHNFFAMTHDVHFRTSVWDNVLKRPIVTERDNHNNDRTEIWGAHAEYTQPLGTQGWKIGWLGTANQISHPKIPEFVLESVRPIPRDPGHTWSFNAGVGLSRTIGGSTFGVDLIHEPMSSSTWADAAKDTAIVGGGTIKAGGKTVENSFTFRNTAIRVGYGHDYKLSGDTTSTLGFQLGLGLYSVNYLLGQQNNIQKTFREQRESWMEWTPTVGFAYKSGSVTLRYNFSSSCVISRCLSFADKVNVVQPDMLTSAGGGVIVAPSSALTFDGGTATSHKLWISVPIR